MEWAQREKERKLKEKKCGEEKGKKREEEMRVYLNPEGRGLSCFEEEF